METQSFADNFLFEVRIKKYAWNRDLISNTQK